MSSRKLRQTRRHRHRDSSSKRVRMGAPSSSLNRILDFPSVVPPSPGIDTIARQSNSNNSTTSPIDSYFTSVCNDTATSAAPRRIALS